MVDVRLRAAVLVPFALVALVAARAPVRAQTPISSNAGVGVGVWH